MELFELLGLHRSAWGTATRSRTILEFQRVCSYPSLARMDLSDHHQLREDKTAASVADGLLARLAQPLLAKVLVTRTAYTFNAQANPFFVPPPDCVPLLGAGKPDPAVYAALDLPKTPQQLNPEWLTLLCHAERPDRALALGPWLLLSLKQVMSTVAARQRRGLLWTDLALCYVGMGHVLVLRWFFPTGALFLQPDGGSNGYERENYRREYEALRHPPSATTLTFGEFLSLAARCHDGPAAHILDVSPGALWRRCSELLAENDTPAETCADQ